MGVSELSQGAHKHHTCKVEEIIHGAEHRIVAGNLEPREATWKDPKINFFGGMVVIDSQKIEVRFGYLAL